MTFIEIVYPERTFEAEDEPCPKCDGLMVFQVVPCPEGRVGCLVIHYGYVCLSCGTGYKKERD